jgi:hypothetical protein
LKLAWIASCALAAGCLDGLDPEWQLDHERIVAVRATPPHIASGQIAQLDALVAHKGSPTSLEQPSVAAAAFAPQSIAGAVQLGATGWQVVAPDAAALDDARTALRLPAGAPVPLDVVLQLPDSAGNPLNAKKTVWLGDSADNPASVGNVLVAGSAPPANITIAKAIDVHLTTDVDPTDAVMWLTSCGTMHDDDEHAAFIHVEPKDRTDGELVVVVRDTKGGVVWQVWPIQAQ